MQLGDPPSGLVSQRTVFGWILSGSYGPCSVGQVNSGCHIAHQLFCAQNIHDSDLRQLWDIELEPELKVVDPVLKKFIDSIEFHDGRYEVSLLWKLSENGPNLWTTMRVLGSG